MTTNKVSPLEEKRLRRAEQQAARLDEKLQVKRDADHQVWRCKEMLDLLGDVILAGEMPSSEIKSLYLQLGFLIDHFDIPSRLSPGRREVLGKAIVAEYRKAEKKERIARIKKGEM